MENPVKEISRVFNLIDCVHSPELQKAAIEKYFLPDAGFKYPVFQVEAGPKSRDKLLRVYQWLHIVSPRTKGVITHIVYDKAHNILLLNVTQHLHLRYLPMWPSNSKMLTRLTLKKQSGLQYIAYQEDFMHPDNVAGLLFPPLKVIITMILLWAGTLLSILAAVVERLGIFAVPQGPEDDLKARRKRTRRANKNGNHVGEPLNTEGGASTMESLSATSAKILYGRGSGEQTDGQGTQPQN